ncbi:aminodeoxychorismate synthase component I [Coralloluteibacterium stylophorae]|uniref:Aminodeoxychorismate synthase component I n=1 Tax=Coralloluteibacterium stylophorae TaxID=1776034 RepID=A0A8J8AZB3_9GAMM|nr:aminodeoxychorismate synthase component I [Coralloluteibacterium stylophorae]MBS7457627.1 aminodeoxychorismate synthase component I [Coralloluteibacterium stylophorae]
MIHVRALPPDTDLLAVHRHAPMRYRVLLESAATPVAAPADAAVDARPRLSPRWDMLLLADGTGLRCDRDGAVRAFDGDATRAQDGRFLECLDAAWQAARTPRSDSPIPFRGGWALLLAYELAGQVEPVLDLPPAEGALPVALALRCPAAILRDRHSGEALAVVEADHPQARGLLERIEADVAAASGMGPATAWQAPVTIEEDPPQRYLDGVRAVQDYLGAGDVFQVNLSRGWRARFAAPPDPAAFYARLRAANPAPFAGLLAASGWALASSSPERLVSVRGDDVQTRPIAGTRARVDGDDADQRVRELVGHPKERAEHVMLIDLERNDLGRVCTPGSVEVDELMGIESYAHVHHIVSNVRGTLRPGITPGQAIAAVFPGGTITGCPKVRCMQIIAELERTGRGAYTGALGWLNRDGDMDLNILIRSAWIEGTGIGFRAGAGIVVDSDPERELEETRAKARGLLRAFGPA